MVTSLSLLAFPDMRRLHHPMLDGRVLELWPDGVIMKPMRYSEEEWAAVMQVNRTWPYPAECTGARQAYPLLLAAT